MCYVCVREERDRDRDRERQREGQRENRFNKKYVNMY